MIDKIKELELIARQLEPDRGSRASIRKKIIDYTESFLDQTEVGPGYQNLPEKSQKLSEEIFTDEPTSIDKIMKKLPAQIDVDGINPASGRHLGYIPGGGLYTSSLGDYWSDITNRYVGVYFANPGAVRVENRLIRWMADLVKYPQSAVGNLTSGGSIANLIAVVTAREQYKITVDKVKKAVIYLSSQVHHSIYKAIKIAGLEEAQIRHIELDNRYKLQPELLKQHIEEDRQNGLLPFMVIASAGTTDTGAVDPLGEIGRITTEYKLWYHIDGAYGAFFLLTNHGKEVFEGIELSDSVVMDPHKGLFLPYGLGAVIVKNGDALKNAFSESANYLQDLTEPPDQVSPADVSPELTKPFRGLRLWLPLKIHGISPFRAALDEKLLLAQYAHSKLNEMEGFQTGPLPELSVVTFWYVPKHGDINEFNQKLVNEIHKNGQIFISSTTIEGRFTLRFAILVFRTHIKEINLALDILHQKAHWLEKQIK